MGVLSLKYPIPLLASMDESLPLVGHDQTKTSKSP